MSDEKYYKIKGSTLTGMADFIRKTTGRNLEYTPSEMLTALGSISYIPQGYAGTNIKLQDIKIESSVH